MNAALLPSAEDAGVWDSELVLCSLVCVGCMGLCLRSSADYYHVVGACGSNWRRCRGCWDWSGQDTGGGPLFDTHDGWQLSTVVRMVDDMDFLVHEVTTANHNDRNNHDTRV